MLVLEQLWRGNISPADRFVKRGSEYQRISTAYCELIDKLLEGFQPEAKEQWEASEELRRQMTTTEQEDAFVCGFRLGARTMLDVVGEYNGRFYTPGEAG